jgi:protein ImuB
MRRREAQSCCPGLEVLGRDFAGEARLWEPAVAAVEAFAPGVEVLQPGQLALGARGPARYFGGELALAAKVVAAVEQAVGQAVEEAVGQAGGQALRQEVVAEIGCRVGVADGLFAASLAARVAGREPVVVPGGGSAEFLSPMPLEVLSVGSPESPGVPDLVDLLGRLGVRTLGEFASLPPASVLGRFGVEGMVAHRLASGLSGRPVKGRVPPPDWAIAAELSPPAEELQAAIFVGRALAEQLHERLAARGLVCTRLAVEVETEQGATLRRSWRHEGALSATAIGERVRWQLEGWSAGGTSVVGTPAGGTPAGGFAADGLGKPGRVTKLALVPEEVRPGTGRQLGFWGEDAGASARAARALARVQSLLGPEAVMTAVLQGGRDYREQVRFVPWGEPREPLSAGGRGRGGKGGPAEGVSEGVSGRGPAGGGAGRGGKGGKGGKGGPAGQARGPRVPAGRRSQSVPPWPGKLAGLPPATVYGSPLPAEVLDEAGTPVAVGSRGTISAPPAFVVVGEFGQQGEGHQAGRRARAGRRAVAAWAGPWPLEERWWDAGGRRRARLQVLTTTETAAAGAPQGSGRGPGKRDGTAFLLVREKSRWWVEALYD